MKVAYLGSEKLGNAFIDGFNRTDDGVQFTIFPTVDDFLSKSKSQRLLFDRMVVSPMMFRSLEEVKSLSVYTRRVSPMMPIVFLCKNDVKGLDMANHIFKIFNSRIHIDFFTDKATTRDIVAIVRNDVDSLLETYSLREVVEVQVMGSEDEVLGGDAEVVTDSPEVTESPTEDTSPVLQTSVVESPKGFGSKKKTKAIINLRSMNEEAFLDMLSGGKPVVR